MLVKGDIPKLLLAGMKEQFMERFDQIDNEHERIATVIDSESSSETYAWLGGTPKMREWKDERVPQGLKEHNYTILNRDFESSISVDRNAFADEQYGQIETRVQQLADEASRHFEEMAFTLINQGENEVGDSGTLYSGVDLKAYDGEAYFSSNHEEDESGTQSNIEDSSDAALDTDTVQAAITAMKSLKDDKGKPAHINPDLIVVPTDYEFAAREILNSAYYPSEGTDTAKLATNVLQGALDLVESPYLDSDAFYLFDTNRVVNPLIMQMRKQPEFTSLTEGTEAAFMRKKMYFGVDWRGEILWGDWRTGYKVDTSN
ncbi:MAG: Mu-like prophage major head subunit gpT family protein [archaeon]